MLDRRLLQHFADVLADLDPLARLAAATGRIRLQHHDLARQVVRQRLADRGFARRFGSASFLGLVLGVGLAFRLGLFEILKLELKLLNRPLQLLRGATLHLAAQVPQHRLQVLDLNGAGLERSARRQRFGARRDQLKVLGVHSFASRRNRRSRSHQRRFQRINRIGKISFALHDANLTDCFANDSAMARVIWPPCITPAIQSVRCASRSGVGRTLQVGIRQSMPSASIAACAVVKVTTPSFA